MVNIIKYSSSKRREWNDFLTGSKNGTFLFNRDYVEYHGERFTDFSLMVYDGGELIALLPANIDSDQLVSHGGLSFGGFIVDSRMKVSIMLKIFNELIKLMQAENINKLIYKKIPYIYHSIPSDEDLYALSKIGARLTRRDVSSTIYFRNIIPFQKNRIRAIKKAEHMDIGARESEDFSSFWRILQSNLWLKHNKYPVHSLDEIIYLRNKFPRNIRLFASHKDYVMIAGVVVYESSNVAHVQYIASDPNNNIKGSLDIILSYIIKKYSSEKTYFDFGISTENNGIYLNEGLAFFKEGFGARAVVHDFYEVDINE